MDSAIKSKQSDSKQAHQANNVEQIQVSAGSSQVNTLQSTTYHKKESSKDSTDSTAASGQQHTSHVNSSQSHPKKRSGFVITSVKDNVDGDESADDLDESHASYSDISYSRATDIDHDQESSASDETLNVTAADGTTTQNNLAQNKLPVKQTATLKDQQTADPSPQVKVQYPQNTPGTQDTKSRGEVFANVKNETQPTANSTSANAQVGGLQMSGYPNEKSSGSISQSNTQSNQAQPASQFKVPAAVKAPISFVASSSSSSTATTRSSSTSTTQKGGSRVYKVVKRETTQPTKREKARWICYDYGDVQSPNLGFVVSSASDSKITFDPTQNYSNQLPLSVSATSVPSSASAYSLQHSDSASSIHRDSMHSYGVSIASNPVQPSASASSVNYDPDLRKITKLSKSVIETQENQNKSFSTDDRSTKNATDQELQSVIHSSGELSNPTETEEESATNERIDNKIEAAMDLVKKHLMLAVRDEVDVLKERIVELQQEVDVMKNVLTPEQMAHIQPILNKSTSSHLSTLQLLQDNMMTSQAQPVHSHTGHVIQTQKQSVPTNPTNRAANSTAVSSQVKSQPQNVPAAKPNPAPLNHPAPASQQQAVPPPHQPASQKPPQSTQITRPYPQGSAVFQPVPPQVNPSQSQLTAQQIQAMRQHQQALQQVSGSQSGSQPGYQSPQVVLQQPNLTSMPQQVQVPPGSQIPPGAVIQTGHPSFQQIPSSITQQTPVTANITQPQFATTHPQPGVNRMTSVGGQGPPRVTQPAQVTTTTSGSTVPSMHSQSTFQPAAGVTTYPNPQAPQSTPSKNSESKASQT